MRRYSIRWLLLGVAGATLLLPILAVVFLRRFDVHLIRQTEKELSVQGALVAAFYQEMWADVAEKPLGNPRDPTHATNSYLPHVQRIFDVNDVAPPAPDPLPTRLGPAWGGSKGAQRAERLSRNLKNAQIFNLSGVRVLDAQGCVVSSSRAQLDKCFYDLPEVNSALSGRPRSVLRRRVSDEPPPALSSLRRGGDLRVFVSLPVFNDAEVIGAVLLSRTSESGLEWIFKQRRDVFYGGLSIVALAIAISSLFSLWITRPLTRMAKILRTGESENKGVNLADVTAPIEIHLLGVALDERAAQLEQKRQYVTEFAANVSHELKTPLTSIRGAIELLQDTQNEMSEEQQRRFLSNIDDAAARTSRLITRLLMLARLETKNGRQQEDGVTIDDWASAFPARYGQTVELQVQGETNEVYSATSLETVVGNLVENALRYRRKLPVQITIESSVKADQEDKRTSARSLHIRVVDDGPGISPENQKHLFERFFTTERDRGGTGLGLAIVLATAKAHDGRVEIQSSSSGTIVDVWM